MVEPRVLIGLVMHWLAGPVHSVVHDFDSCEILRLLSVSDLLLDDARTHLQLFLEIDLRFSAPDFAVEGRQGLFVGISLEVGDVHVTVCSRDEAGLSEVGSFGRGVDVVVGRTCHHERALLGRTADISPGWAVRLTVLVRRCSRCFELVDLPVRLELGRDEARLGVRLRKIISKAANCLHFA